MQPPHQASQHNLLLSKLWGALAFHLPSLRCTTRPLQETPPLSDALLLCVQKLTSDTVLLCVQKP